MLKVHRLRPRYDLSWPLLDIDTDIGILAKCNTAADSIIGVNLELQSPRHGPKVQRSPTMTHSVSRAGSEGIQSSSIRVGKTDF